MAAEVHSATKQPLAPGQVRALLREALGRARDSVELRDGEFTVCYAAGDVVLKVWPEPGTPLLAYEEGLVHGEAELCRRAPEVGFPGPELVHLDTSHGLVDRDWLVMMRLPGTPLPQAGAGVDVERELGEAVARLHRVTGGAFGYVGRPALQAATWREAFGRILAAVLEDAVRYEARLPFAVEDVQAALEAAAPALDEAAAPALVHFDAWAGNVLVAGGRLSGVIDGERSLYADPLAEWAMLAFDGDPAERPELVAGYGGLELDAAARARLDLYRLYLFLIVLVEEVPRRYDPVQRAPLRARVERAALECLARLLGEDPCSGA
jgi:aminoglycoside phosphotransferase (APT) family kinase protein